MKNLMTIFAILLITVSGLSAQDIQLNPPDLSNPVLKALQDRQSTRSFASTDIPVEELSNILWAGFGINRPESGKRTAPSAFNAQDIDIYVLMESGCYLYDASAQVLRKVQDKDLRPLVALQEYAENVPVHLLFVSNFSKLERTGDRAEVYAMSSAALIAENVFVYCSSIGMGCIIRANMKAEEIHKELGLTENQHVILSEAIGYPGTE